MTTALGTLERWELHGALWRVRSLGEDEAVVVLCTCHGEPVDEVRHITQTSEFY